MSQRPLAFAPARGDADRMSRARRLLVAALLATGLGCGADGDGPLTAEDALGRWAKAFCDYARRCDQRQLTSIGVRPEDCERRVMADLTSDGDPRCVAGANYDGNMARSCIRELETSRCEDERASCKQVCRRG